MIAKRGRDEYLRMCLSYLNVANSGNKYDVSVYIVSDDYLMKVQDIWRYENLAVGSDVISNAGSFCKGQLLNYGLKQMRPDFDYVSIVDLDLIYNERFFDTIVEQVKDDVWFISSGNKLIDRDGVTYPLEYRWNDLASFIYESDRALNHQRAYPSQITLTKNLFERVLKFLDGNFYCKDFIGWGGEDTALSFLSYKAEKAAIFKKVYDFDMWYHLWHKRFDGFKKEEYNQNLEVLQEFKTKYLHRVGEI